MLVMCVLHTASSPAQQQRPPQPPRTGTSLLCVRVQAKRDLYCQLTQPNKSLGPSKHAALHTWCHILHAAASQQYFATQQQYY
eukprot:866-Heterococcus_DN1.PRE.4